jgi:ATP-dependent DNA ligase
VLGVVREQGEAPLALLAAADGSRKYVGAAVIGLNRAMRERLWERVAGMPGRAPKGIPIKKPNAQWIKPGLVGHVRFLKGEGGLRHATLTCGRISRDHQCGRQRLSCSAIVAPQLVELLELGTDR